MATTKAIIHVAGWKNCSYFAKTANVIASLQHLFPESIVADIQEHPDRDTFKSWLANYREAEYLPLFTETLGERAAKHTSSPFVWRDTNQFIGGCDDTFAYVKNNFLNMNGAKGASNISPALADDSANSTGHNYEYDLVVIGGGSGGLACSKAAAQLGAKVLVLDYVKPSPLGSTWGLGGTCVNVGCIPKKLMHHSSIIGELIHKDSTAFGWSTGEVTHSWSTLVSSVQDYIRSLNFKYRVDLRSKSVKYENLLGRFTDPHTLLCSNPQKNISKSITARRFVIAVGGRPRALSCPGGEHALSSDDIFQLDRSPGKTLVVGASYVALECAGFLHGIGYDVTIMVRSILLRGFDQDMAERIGAYMEEGGVKFIRLSVPSLIEKRDDGKFRVVWNNASGAVAGEDVFDTVLNATGRDPDVSQLGLDAADIKINPKTGKIAVNHEQTSVPHVYAIGDVIDAPELTPVAIKAGTLLANRLYSESKEVMNYDLVCTTVFTPIEYGTCGISEEKAIEVYGNNVEIYHQSFNPLEWSLSDTRKTGVAYVKVICNKSDSMRVVGFHYLGPNAGEITQGVGVAMKMHATFNDFINTVGIHPTTAEIFTTLSVTKSSGASAEAGGC